MKKHNVPLSAQPEEIVPFFKRTLPFSELDDQTIRDLARSCTIDFLPAGMRLLTRGETMIDQLMVIQRGAIKLYLTRENGEERLVDYRGEGGTVGALGLIRDTYASLNADTVEDTFVFKIPAEVFRGLIEKHPAVSSFYLKSLSEDYVSKAFSELRQHQAAMCTDTALYLFSTKVEDIIKREPVWMESGISIRECARTMHREGIGSLLITDPYGKPEGIITDKDLRRAMAEGESYETPVEHVMSSPVATVKHTEMCFEALLKMMGAKIHHLAVTREGKVMGMITSHDIMVLQGRSPITLFRDIQAARTIEGLYEHSRRTPVVVGTLMEEGAKAGNVTRMITVLNDLILEKLLSMLQSDFGPPPVPFCWLIMGSEGRKEQTIKTDQDNALVYRDPRDEREAEACERYFKTFTEAAVEHLKLCGYHSDPYGLMASNLRWRMPLQKWRDYFEHLIMMPEPEEVLHATIFFDFRGGYGHKALSESLRDHVALKARRQDVFLRYLAQDCVAKRPPLSFFRNFIVDKNGEHKNTLDLKEKSMVQFVDFGRVLALKHGITETNTLERLRLLGEGQHISRDLSSDAMGAYEFIMQLRLVHQLDRVAKGLEANNNLNPAELSDLEKETLKEAFGVINRLHSHLKDEFRLRNA
ncbi:MAG: putative nucleotidyltransferase substrate binding domain-containing protein [Desulfovibrionales bacterium]